MKNSLLLLLACLATLPARGQEETPFTRLFDTGVASANPLADDAVSKRVGWALIPEDKVDHKFLGDTVLLNDKLTVVLRKQGRGAEVYSKAASGLKARANVSVERGTRSVEQGTLGPGDLGTVGAGICSLDALKTIENNSGAVMVEASFMSAVRGRPVPAPTEAVALRFRLTTGEGILEIRSDEEAGFVNVESKTRYVVVPDYFGDDMVFDLRSPLPSLLTGAGISPAGVRRNLALPAENFCLSLLEGGEAIVMNVWQSNEQDAWLAATGSGKEGQSTRISCLKRKRIWLAFLEAPGLWHAATTLAKDEPPFPAKWRCSLVRANSLADSWDLDRGPDPEQTAGRHQGPLIVYPIDRSAATPLTATCPTDVMRNTLGVGPCQYILACEGLGAQGDPTPNSVMTWVEKMFEGKRENKVADDIKERLQQMAEHVAQARARIERYAEFAGQIRRLLASKQVSSPFSSIVDDLGRFVAAGSAPAANPERARQLAAEVLSLIGQGDSVPAGRRLGEQLRSIGALQDSALAKCRMAVRRLRQQARTDVTNQPQEAGLAREVQRFSEQMLRAQAASSAKDADVKP